VHQFNWTPGIGDPTIGGWITVLLYFLAAISCWRTARKAELLDKKIWYAISISFVALGINKELDLQTALTELGRMLAIEEGWYKQRETVQLYFIVAVSLISGWALISLLVWARHSPVTTWFALPGTTSVISYVLIRAASFHHIDRFVGSTVCLASVGIGFWKWVELAWFSWRVGGDSKPGGAAYETNNLVSLRRTLPFVCSLFNRGELRLRSVREGQKLMVWS
jgi:hypothetical protein